MNEKQKAAISQYLLREEVSHFEYLSPEVGDRRETPAFLSKVIFRSGMSMVMCVEPDGSRHT